MVAHRVQVVKDPNGAVNDGAPAVEGVELREFVGIDDLVLGTAQLIAVVGNAIPVPAFDRADPIFRLPIERSLWVHWERPGQKDTRAIRRRWPEARS